MWTFVGDMFTTVLLANGWYPVFKYPAPANTIPFAFVVTVPPIVKLKALLVNDAYRRLFVLPGQLPYG